jgi:hypothetical protein
MGEADGCGAWMGWVAAADVHGGGSSGVNLATRGGRTQIQFRNQQLGSGLSIFGLLREFIEPI